MSNDAMREALKSIREQFTRCHDGELALVHVGLIRGTIDEALATPPPSVSAEPRDEWAAFLAWRDDYSRHSDPCEWPAWQARAALNPPPPSAPYVPLSDGLILRQERATPALDDARSEWLYFASAIEKLVVERMEGKV